MRRSLLCWRTAPAALATLCWPCWVSHGAATTSLAQTPSLRARGDATRHSYRPLWAYQPPLTYQACRPARAASAVAAQAARQRQRRRRRVRRLVRCRRAAAGRGGFLCSGARRFECMPLNVSMCQCISLAFGHDGGAVGRRVLCVCVLCVSCAASLVKLHASLCVFQVTTTHERTIVIVNPATLQAGGARPQLPVLLRRRRCCHPHRLEPPQQRPRRSGRRWREEQPPQRRQTSGAIPTRHTPGYSRHNVSALKQSTCMCY